MRPGSAGAAVRRSAQPCGAAASASSALAARRCRTSRARSSRSPPASASSSPARRRASARISSGIPFQDPSGVRLRDWMALDEAAFYDRDRVAILPMGFCFPGHDAQRATCRRGPNAGAPGTTRSSRRCRRSRRSWRSGSTRSAITRRGSACRARPGRASARPWRTGAATSSARRPACCRCRIPPGATALAEPQSLVRGRAARLRASCGAEVAAAGRRRARRSARVQWRGLRK